MDDKNVTQETNVINQQENQCPDPNMNVVRGVLFLLLGIMFIALAYKIILKILYFIIGSVFMYYGFRLLNFRAMTTRIDRFFVKVTKFF